MTVKMRHIYVGDIHGNKKFPEFVKKFDDGNSFFVLAGDFFDRGKHSYEVAETIKRLLSEKKCGGVLGNHDLLFVIPKIFPESEQAEWYFQSMLFPTNGGDATLDSFIRNTIPKSAVEKSASDVTSEEAGVTKAYVSELARILFDNFKTYYLDALGNITIHGGIPILGNGELIGEGFGGTAKFGLEYVKELDSLLRNGDETTLMKFRGWYPNSEILKFLNEKYGTAYVDWFHSDYKNYLPTWFGNDLYENEPMRTSLKNELERNGLSKIFCGHVGNRDENFGRFEKVDFIFRLDRSFFRTDENDDDSRGIGFCVVSEANEIIEVGTF